jgi:aspartate aminotransferase/aminotransferase
MMSVLNPGDEVIVHEPTWVSYPEQVKLCYGVPVMMPYTCTVRDYEKYITERSKLIVINNPHNPRGEVLTRKDLEYLVGLARANGLYVLADEAYSDFLIDEEFHSLGLFDSDKSNVIICNSISKNFGISGWRLGYCITNEQLTNQVLKVNQHLITCPASILQYYMARHFETIIKITYPQIAAVVKKRRALSSSWIPLVWTISQAPRRFTSSSQSDQVNLVRRIFARDCLWKITCLSYPVWAMENRATPLCASRSGRNRWKISSTVSQS